MDDELQRLLDAWLAELPWYKRWEINAGLIASGYKSITGRWTVSAGIGCGAILAAVIAGLVLALLVAICKTR